MNRIKRVLLSAVMAIGLSTPALVPAVAHAADTPNIRGALNCGSNLEANTAGCDTPATGEADAQGIITGAVNIISLVVGIVAVIMIIVGGFKYITSSGDSGKVGSAKNTILYAIIGLVVVALAQVIVKFVLNRLATDVPGGNV